MKMRLLPLVILMTLGLVLAGVAQAAPNDPGVTGSVQRSDPQDAISPAPSAPRTAVGPQSGATATPHPILSDVRVRRAIAYCTDKTGLLAAAYPDLTPEQRQALIADTFIRPTSWAYTAPATTYPYAPTTGQTLLDQAGWTLEQGATYRTRGGKELVLTLRTTTAAFRVAFLTVFEAQMQACGIRVIREHLDASWFFGSDGAFTGIRVRDFELGEFAWIMPDTEPEGRELYACDQIPTPANGWRGQNYPGWCSAEASVAIVTATDTAVSQALRRAAYAVVIDAAAAELPSLPLFWRDDGTGNPSETYEHIDFNLETFSQDAELAPATATTLNTADYAGNAGSVEVPAGAVAQDTTLSYYPLIASAYAAPQGKTLVSPFRLTAVVQGVPQTTFTFITPVILTVRYDDASLSSIWDEAALNLYRWVAGTGWRPAQESCPEDQRYYHVDRATNTVQVHICHLNEYALMGGTKHIVYLPLLMRNWIPSFTMTSITRPSMARTTRCCGISLKAQRGTRANSRPARLSSPMILRGRQPGAALTSC
jgi:peptide/nickel transport system substrate-binding protein